MTTVRPPKRFVKSKVKVQGKLLAIVMVLMFAGNLAAQESSRHRLYQRALPPGAIGSQRLVGGGALLSYYTQPVKVTAPEGARVAFVSRKGFGNHASDPQTVGMHVGRVYRMSVINIPGEPGVEVYPSIEIVDRLYPPPGEAMNFPIPIELTKEELLLAAKGRLVTRIIYVENPETATAIQGEKDHQSWFEVRAGEDPLKVADRLGRPVAILRIGSRLPDLNGNDNRRYFFGASEPVLLKRELAK